MAGSISLSLAQQFDSTGAPLNGGLLTFYAAGTTTLQSAYQDSSLTLPWPNPIVLDSAGRVPPFYLADGQIKIRLTDAAGVVQVAADNLLVVGASSGSGTAPTVDATTILATGDIKVRYGTGALTGFARVNGRTIGSATSGASERANADCEDLFVYLWGEDENLTVSTGRGASAAADWAANKTIALPDWRGRTIAADDDMGGGDAGRLTSTYFGATARLGVAGGTESNNVILTHTHAITDPGHVHMQNGSGTGGASGHLLAPNNGTDAVQNNTDNTDSSTTGITVSNAGSASAHNIVQPTMIATFYIKL